jgi:hypothetical protein
MLSRKVKLAQSQSEFDAQISAFLVENGFPDAPAYQRAAASMIQMLPDQQDFFYPKKLAAQMRRAKANELAFYLIYPDKRPKDPTSEENGTPEANGNLEQEAKA